MMIASPANKTTFFRLNLCLAVSLVISAGLQRAEAIPKLITIAVNVNDAGSQLSLYSDQRRAAGNAKFAISHKEYL